MQNNQRSRDYNSKFYISKSGFESLEPKPIQNILTTTLIPNMTSYKDQSQYQKAH